MRRLERKEAKANFRSGSRKVKHTRGLGVEGPGKYLASLARGGGAFSGLSLKVDDF